MPTEAGWRLCAAIVCSSFLFDGGSDLGDAVGHYVERVLGVGSAGCYAKSGMH